MSEQRIPKRGRPRKGEEPGLCPDPMPVVPQPAIGIDIGVDGFHLSVPGSPDVEVSAWPVWYISYEKHPDWRDRLKLLLTQGTIVVAEPTGWNYLQPVARLVSLESPAELWLIEHSRTAAVREICNMQQKTDLLNTRALAYAAMQLRITRKFAGCWPFDWEHQDKLLELRFLVNAHHKAISDRTRFNNRLKHLGHSIAPELNLGTAWFKCMAAGAYTPQEIHQLDISEWHGSVRKSVQRLRDLVPATTFVSSTVYRAIVEAHAAYKSADERVQMIEQATLNTIQQSPFRYQWERLMTYPMASAIGCAAIIVATKGMGDQMRLPGFRACLGAFPQVKQSGSSFKSRASKRGYRPAMKALHLWAQALVKASAPENDVRRYFAGGEKAGGRKFNAAKAKLAQHLHAVMRSEGGYDPSRLKWRLAEETL